MPKCNAIIDIGYNAIRAVVYENNELGAPEIFNEKFKSDLNSLLESEDFDIKHHIHLSIKYFLNIFNKLNVTEIYCVATAVLRGHPKAQDFINFIHSKYGFNIRLLTGEQEASLTALGLVHGIDNCDGIAADLGGGSLELVEVKCKDIGKLASLKLGTKVIASRNISDKEELADIIATEYGKYQYNNLYLIGGALRLIGRLYLDFIQYPIKNLHNLRIDISDFANYLEIINTQNDIIKFKFGKRKINMNAVLVAQVMIKTFRPKNIIISTFGLKEGVRMELLQEKSLLSNITEQKIAHACNYDLNITDFNSYNKILESLIKCNDEIYKIFKFSIIFTSLKKKYDRTLSPRAMSEYILSAEIPMPQNVRMMLALINSINSDFKPSFEILKKAKRILTKKEQFYCQIIGNLLGIGEDIDGPVYVSPSFTIKNNNGYYEIDCASILPRPIFEKICVRLKNIAFSIKFDSQNQFL